MFRTLMELPWRDKFDVVRMRGCFDEAGGGTGGGGAGGGTGGAGGSGGSGGSGGVGGGTGGGSEAITFENAGALQARLDRAAQDALQKAAKDAGFDTVEEYQAAAKAAKEAANKAKTDLEKAQDEANKHKTKADQERARADRIAADAEIRILSQREVADGKKFIDEDVAIALIDRAGIKVDDDGKVTGVEDALKALAKAKPHLLEPLTGGQRSREMPGSAGNGQRQTGGGGGESGIGERLAKRNADNSKLTVDAQNKYFS